MENQREYRQAIEAGEVILGIELGSTRIKAILIDSKHVPLASGSHSWENNRIDGIWTYSLEAVWMGIQESYRNLSKDVQSRYGVLLTKVRAIGISAMMHGYLVFDRSGSQLVPFRTWRNTMTEGVADELTEAFGFNIPQRWSIAHLYHAIKHNEVHVRDIDHMTTLAGYVHWQLTGKKVIGVGDASGMFPINSSKTNYDEKMMQTFSELIRASNMPWSLGNILPEVLSAGELGGLLTESGARLLDPTGNLSSGAVLCPPEGDAGTGMVATNSLKVRTGNISAGTSIFAMVVLENPLSQVYKEIDMVTTPTGSPVAMVHCNNCTTELDAWVGIFASFAEKIGVQMDMSSLYTLLYKSALVGASDCGGLLAYNYHSGEPITGLEEGRPLFVRMPNSDFSLENFMRTLLFSTLGTLKMGMDLLTEKEGICLEEMLGHGGFFKVENVGQHMMAAALNVPITVMASAGEGGAWGIALLAAYAIKKEAGESLELFLNRYVFNTVSGIKIEPNPADREGFDAFMKRYVNGLAIERKAVETLVR